MAGSKYWGEMPPADDDFTPDVTADIERSMSKFSLAMYKVDTDENSTSKVENINLPPVDPLVMYAISLHKHINDVTEMMRVAELAAELNLIPPEDAIPKVAPMPEVPVLHKPNSLNYIPKEFTPFSMGQDVEVPELCEAVVKQILTKSVAVLFAHIGFESTHQSILDLMTDVLESFFKKFCHHLKVAVDDSEQDRSGGFPHVTEMVLTELGLGGVKGLHDYYQCRVVKYIDVLLKRSQEVADHYRTLLVPKGPSPVDTRVFRVKVEEEDVADDNPEVHFSLEGGELGFTSLQTGYQLLNTLESGEVENLQSLMETEEDISVGPSPNIVSLQSEADTSHMSPFTKKKKFK